MIINGIETFKQVESNQFHQRDNQEIKNIWDKNHSMSYLFLDKLLKKRPKLGAFCSLSYDVTTRLYVDEAFTRQI